jgi:hypothetical protein
MIKKKSPKPVTEKKATEKVVTDAQAINNQHDRRITIERWPDFHPWPPVGGLRHIRFYAEEKGASECFVKKGGRVLVCERKFLEWASRSDTL